MKAPRDPTRRFSDRAHDYARHRPRYPAGLIPALRRSIGLSPEWVIADVGSGTGISAEPFLRHGNTVFGVEPNDAMCRAAEQHLATRFPNFRSVAAPAEATALPPASIDLIVAAQAFHWFDLDAFHRESRRILKPTGQAALLWNDRHTAGSPFLEAYEALLRTHGTDYARVNHRNVTPEQLHRYFGGPYQHLRLANAQRFDFEGLRGRLLSSSYVPPAGDPRADAMLAALRALFDRHAQGGFVVMSYTTEVYVAPVR